MTYDLSDPLHRKRFLSRARRLADRGRTVELTERTSRSVQQNRYAHVLIRAMALETGVPEAYAKEVYFKRMANAPLFVRRTKDAISGAEVEWLRSSADLTQEEAALALDRFRDWAAGEGYWLPEAHPSAGGGVEFASDEDGAAFFRAEAEADMASRRL